MKCTFGMLWGVAVLLSAASCSSKPDSVEQAQETNNAKAGITNADTTITAKNGGERRPGFDSEFMTKAASGGMLEVQLGQQVAQKATTPEAKQFAQQMELTSLIHGNPFHRLMPMKLRCPVYQ